jgi:hypothetical protein
LPPFKQVRDHFVGLPFGFVVGGEIAQTSFRFIVNSDAPINSIWLSMTRPLVNGDQRFASLGQSDWEFHALVLLVRRRFVAAFIRFANFIDGLNVSFCASDRFVNVDLTSAQRAFVSDRLPSAGLQGLTSAQRALFCPANRVIPSFEA